MSDFSQIERALASLLSGAPALKRLLKRHYLHLVYALAKKTNEADTPFTLMTPSLAGETFFGYYDKTPDNGDGIVLCHRSNDSTSSHPSKVKSIDVVGLTADLQDELFSFPTTAFNWQQGARLQWCTGSTFLFNDYDATRSRYVARLFDSGSRRFLSAYDLPVQDSYRSEFFLTVDYSRLAKLSPDYGYFRSGAVNSLGINVSAPNPADGIWKVDIESGECHLLVPIEAVLRSLDKSTRRIAEHTVNHIMISPCGSKFIFFHRYYVRGVRNDRLMLAQADTGMIEVLLEEKVISHFTWINSETLLGFYSLGVDAPQYRILHLTEGLHTEFSAFKGLPDGHPSCNAGKVLTDTYADRSSRQRLFMAEPGRPDPELLGSFLHGSKFFDVARCDLHPRFSSSGDRIYFDSVFSGKREFCALDF